MNEFPSWLEWLPDGMESWEALVAIATILVALATGGLASATFVLARQTKKGRWGIHENRRSCRKVVCDEHQTDPCELRGVRGAEGSETRPARST